MRVAVPQLVAAMLQMGQKQLVPSTVSLELATSVLMFADNASAAVAPSAGSMPSRSPGALEAVWAFRGRPAFALIRLEPSLTPSSGLRDLSSVITTLMPPFVSLTLLWIRDKLSLASSLRGRPLFISSVAQATCTTGTRANQTSRGVVRLFIVLWQLRPQMSASPLLWCSKERLQRNGGADIWVRDARQ